MTEEDKAAAAQELENLANGLRAMDPRDDAGRKRPEAILVCGLAANWLEVMGQTLAGVHEPGGVMELIRNAKARAK